MARSKRYEIVTVGTNPNLQIVGSDPAGGASDIGLFVGGGGQPLQAVTGTRLLFVLALASFNAHERARLVGFRQLLTIGANLTTASPPATYLLERPVVTPFWKFVDGNAMFSIRKIPPDQYAMPNVANQDGLAFQYTHTPAILFQTVTGSNPMLVTPPQGGSAPGNVLTPELSQWFDMRTDAWSRPVECDVPIEGPCDIAMFVSIKQTNPLGRLAPPATPVFTTINGAVPEDAFVQTYPSAMYMRVAGSLIFESEEWAPGGMPKTYLRTADGDRLTNDRAETGSNEIRRGGQDEVATPPSTIPSVRVKP